MTSDLTHPGSVSFSVLLSFVVSNLEFISEFYSVILRNMPKTSIEALLEAAAYLDRYETG